MRRAFIVSLAALASIACGAQAAVSATASVPAKVRFVQPAGINVGTSLTLPTVSIAPAVTAPSLSGVGASTQPVIRSGGVGNAQLTIRGQAGDVISTTVPESFTVIRSGGQETLTVKTNTNAEYQIGSGDVALGDGILNSDTMSVDIGGSLNLASADNLVPGPYEGLLVVVVQYN